MGWGIVDGAKKIYRDFMRRFYPEGGRKDATIERLAMHLERAEGRAERVEQELARRQSGFDRAEALEARATARNIKLVVEQVGLYRQIEALSSRRERDDSERREDEGVRRRLWKRLLELGKYRRQPTLGMGPSGVVVIQNKAALKFLRKSKMRGVRLTDYVSIDGRDPKIIEVGDKFYELLFTSVGGGCYEVEIRHAPRIYHRRKGNPYVARVRKVELPVKRGVRPT